MKLATLKDGSRDGTLALVSRDLSRAVVVPEIAPTLQAALKSVGSLWQARTGTLSMSFVRARAAINGPL